MTNDQLIQSVMQRVREATKDMLLPVEGKDYLASPSVYYNDVPVKGSEDDDFPYVIVRFYKSTMSETQKLCEVKIIVGAYSEEPDGHRYCLIVAERIEQSLMNVRTLDCGSYIQLPIEWVNLEKQAHPYWAIAGITRWVLPTVNMWSEHV